MGNASSRLHSIQIFWAGKVRMVTVLRAGNTNQLPNHCSYTHFQRTKHMRCSVHRHHHPPSVRPPSIRHLNLDRAWPGLSLPVVASKLHSACSCGSTQRRAQNGRWTTFNLSKDNKIVDGARRRLGMLSSRAEAAKVPTYPTNVKPTSRPCKTLPNRLNPAQKNCPVGKWCMGKDDWDDD